MDVDYFKINEAAYDRFSGEYRKVRETNKEAVEEAILFINHIKKISHDPKILEIGPGAGVTLKEFERVGLRTYAVEISQKMIDTSREVAPSTVYTKGNFLDYNSERDFDGIFSRFVLHLFSETDAYGFVEKAYDLLRPGGIFFASTIFYYSSQEGFIEKKKEGVSALRYKKRWTIGELEALVKGGPFEDFKMSVIDKEHRKIMVQFKKVS